MVAVVFISGRQHHWGKNSLCVTKLALDIRPHSNYCMINLLFIPCSNATKLETELRNKVAIRTTVSTSQHFTQGSLEKKSMAAQRLSFIFGWNGKWPLVLPAVLRHRGNIFITAYIIPQHSFLHGNDPPCPQFACFSDRLHCFL